MFSKLCAAKIRGCAANLFKVLYVDTNFLPKLRKCDYEIKVNICCKSRVALQITERELMTFFFSEISIILGCIKRFPKIADQ